MNNLGLARVLDERHGVVDGRLGDRKNSRDYHYHLRPSGKCVNERVIEEEDSRRIFQLQRCRNLLF